MLGKSKSVMCYQTSQSDSSQSDGSTQGSELTNPLNFDRFIPWVCKQWNVPDSVSVLRLVEEDKIQRKKSADTAKGRSTELKSTEVIMPAPAADKPNADILIYAHYNSHEHLTGIFINKCSINIPRKVILAMSLCVPFHSQLTRLTIRNGGLTHFIVYEISKLLAHSNLTNICLDDSDVPQGNYYCLLEGTSQLNYLSLNRCKINDEVCKRIATNLVFDKPASKFLRALDLASNNITDIGAQYLGTALRSNRCLRHLNVAGNQITDNGASFILNPLMEFELTVDEVLFMKRRKFEFHKNKEIVYKRYVEEISQRKSSITRINRSALTSAKSLASKMSKKSASTTTGNVKPKKPAEQMTDEAVGEFIGPFCNANTEIKDGCIYSKGNFVLCSLNMAYNNLHYPSLQKLDDIVMYQINKCVSSVCLTKIEAIGLLRVVLVGNCMPEASEEIDRIDLFLSSKIINKGQRNKRNTSGGSKGKGKSVHNITSARKSQVVFNT